MNFGWKQGDDLENVKENYRLFAGAIGVSSDDYVFSDHMFGASIVASGAMQGAGDSTACFVLNLFSMWGVRLTLAFLLAPRFGLAGVWTAMCVELCTRGVLFLLRLARGKWLERGALA